MLCKAEVVFTCAVCVCVDASVGTYAGAVMRFLHARGRKHM